MASQMLTETLLRPVSYTHLPRMFPKTIAAVVETASWTPPPIFAHLQQLGSVEQEEMLRTFNMGIGLIAACLLYTSRCV